MASIHGGRRQPVLHQWRNARHAFRISVSQGFAGKRQVQIPVEGPLVGESRFARLGVSAHLPTGVGSLHPNSRTQVERPQADRRDQAVAGRKPRHLCDRQISPCRSTANLNILARELKGIYTANHEKPNAVQITHEQNSE